MQQNIIGQEEGFRSSLAVTEFVMKVFTGMYVRALEFRGRGRMGPAVNG